MVINFGEVKSFLKSPINSAAFVCNDIKSKSACVVHIPLNSKAA